ncbi:outer membrane protein [Paracoccus zhejiangensis]|uniref:Porin family protein n=1 Tax=Paracoccus zhejiangensis TaxID=1077935 RepID=A0A2H5EZP0_9RHOB|nr:outer membrane beta-barrel protein [Paracoccus zhejiangensis]AUH64761.1 porin family protein [Paracoccus zhejiangensis]
MFTISKTPFAAAAALALLAPVAHAGGYTAPVEPAPVIAPVTAAPAPWAGAYAGLGLGYAFGADDVVGVSDATDTLLGSPGSVDLKGMTYGLHLGYRWQRDVGGRQVVFGPELAYEASNADASFDTGTANAMAEMDNFVALRMKTGVLNAAGDTLFYGIAGIGRGDFNYAVEGLGMDYDGSYKDNAWILGLGAERRLSERMSIFGEWEFRGFGKTTLTDANGFMTEATPEHHHVKLGVNFSF